MVITLTRSSKGMADSFLKRHKILPIPARVEKLEELHHRVPLLPNKWTSPSVALVPPPSDTGIVLDVYVVKFTRMRQSAVSSGKSNNGSTELYDLRNSSCVPSLVTCMESVLDHGDVTFPVHYQVGMSFVGCLSSLQMGSVF